MSLTSLRILGLVAIMAAVVAGRPAVAQGLLHKHAHRPLGVPMTLPGQQGVASAVTATTAIPAGAADGASGIVAGGAAGAATASSPGAVPGVPAVTLIAPGADLSVDAPAIDPGGALGDGIVCVMPLPDGQPGHPHVFHTLTPGATSGSPGMIGAVEGGPLLDPGVVDPGVGDVVSIMPLLDAPLDGVTAAPVATLGLAHGAGIDRHHGDNRPMMAAANRSVGQGFAPAAADASANAGAQARFGGLPGRAAGMRADPASSGVPHARSAANAQAPKEPAGARATSAGTGSVRQASATHVAKAGTGHTRVPAPAAEAPRWRDRLRFAWPTTK